MKLTSTLYEAIPLEDTKLRGIVSRYTHDIQYKYKRWSVNGKINWLGLNIVIGGKSGSGKSSFVNHLIRKTLFQTDDVQACTRNVQSVFLFQGALLPGQKALSQHDLSGVLLTDLPGISESVCRQYEYEELHRIWIEDSYRFVYLVKADDRALEIDEKFISSIPTPIKEKLLIGISQADRIAPYREWKTLDAYRGAPSFEQSKNLQRKIDDIAYRFRLDPYFIQPFSAHGSWQLESLMHKLFL
ncbi:MAG: GTPase [Bacteroidota bacterium]